MTRRGQRIYVLQHNGEYWAGLDSWVEDIKLADVVIWYDLRRVQLRIKRDYGKQTEPLEVSVSL